MVDADESVGDDTEVEAIEGADDVAEDLGDESCCFVETVFFFGRNDRW